MLLVEQVLRQAHCFDIIHFHVDYLHYPASRRQHCPHVTTLHGRLDLPVLGPLYREFSDIPVVSISNAQRLPLPMANWQGTVYHGLPKDLFTFREQPGDYLAFIGRTSPEKGLDQAILIAQRAGMKLKIAAKVDKVDEEYFQQTIQPMLHQSPEAKFLGEIGGADKDEFLGNAHALLFPIDWPEPFGLVMIEAMACGTPVIAYRRGSVLEVLKPGVSGLVVDGLEEAVRAVGQVANLDRKRCRREFEERFSAERMTTDYVAIYRRLLGEAVRKTNGRHRSGRLSPRAFAGSRTDRR
jgi:glycosyltransferase involved in cell wall biosynthesis